MSRLPDWVDELIRPTSLKDLQKQVNAARWYRRRAFRAASTHPWQELNPDTFKPERFGVDIIYHTKDGLTTINCRPPTRKEAG